MKGKGEEEEEKKRDNSSIGDMVKILFISFCSGLLLGLQANCADCHRSGFKRIRYGP